MGPLPNAYGGWRETACDGRRGSHAFSLRSRELHLLKSGQGRMGSPPVEVVWGQTRVALARGRNLECEMKNGANMMLCVTHTRMHGACRAPHLSGRMRNLLIPRSWRPTAS